MCLCEHIEVAIGDSFDFFGNLANVANSMMQNPDWDVMTKPL